MGSKNRIDIEIGTKGAPESKRALSDVKESAENVTGATKGQGAASEQAAAGVEKLTRKTGDFDRDAKKLVLSVLGGINPALRGMADFALDAFEGIGKLSARLLAVTGIGVAVAAGFALISNAAEEVARQARAAHEAMERMNKAAADASRDQLSRRETVAEALEKAGILGVAKPAAETAAALESQGMPADLARFGAVAQRVGTAQGPLSDDQVLQVIGAYLAGGRKDGLDKGYDQARQSVAKLLRVNEVTARDALSAKLRDVGLAERAKGATQAPPDFDVQLAAALGRLGESQLYSEDELKIMERVARGQDVEGVLRDATRNARPLDYEGWNPFVYKPRADIAAGSDRNVKPPGSQYTLGELLDTLQRELDRQSELEGTSGFDIERLANPTLQGGPRARQTPRDSNARVYSGAELREVERARDERSSDHVLARLVSVLERMERGGQRPVVVNQSMHVEHAYDLPGLQRSVPAPELMDGTVR